MKIDREKIKYYIEKGYIDAEEHVKFKYIVEILRLFKINVNGWMKGSYIINDNEGIMFINVQNKDWTDTIDEEYMYELCNKQKDIVIEKRNDYWSNKIIYVFYKAKNDDYEFIGCFKQDQEKIEELFNKGIRNQRAYKKIGSRLNLKNFN